MKKLINQIMENEKKWELLDLRLSMLELNMKQDELDRRLQELGV